MARRALLIANQSYDDKRIAPLSMAEEVSQLRNLLLDPGIGMFDEVTLLLDQPAAATTTTIDEFIRRTRPRDTTVLYIAGHTTFAGKSNPYLLPSDADLDRLAATAISVDSLRRSLAEAASRLFIWLDCGYSGEIAARIVNPLNVVIAAATLDQIGSARDPGEVTLTATIVAGLSTGAAATAETGIVTPRSLWNYVRARMSAGTSRPAPVLYGDARDDVPIAKTPSGSWPQSLKREHVDWINDAPAETDLLQRQALAQVLAARLTRVSEDPGQASFLIHVDGPWGSGKSTLLKLLDDELAPTHLIVPFNAWRNARVQPPWWSLLTAIRDRVIRDRAWIRRPWSAARETWARARRSGAPYFLAMLITAALLGGAYLVLAPVWTTTELKTTATTVTAVTAAVGVLWAVCKIAARLLLWNSARGARLLERSHTDPMGEVSDHFGWLINHSRRPVVVFIDDLDRCDGPIVVDILEAIQTLARDQPAPASAASFVIAADGAWLRRSYENHYASFEGAVDQPGQPLGYLFQEKLFQLSIPVPAVDGAARAAYLTTLLGGRADGAGSAPQEQAATSQRIEESASEAEVLEVLEQSPLDVRQKLAPQAAMKLAQPEIEAVTEHSLEKFAPLLQANPRGVKRFLNTYSILRTLRTLEGNIVATDTLATWALLRSRWPQLADHLEQHPDDIALVREQTVRELPRPLRSTATSAELQAFLSTAEVQLTAPEIRACCGTTDGSPQTTQR